MKYRSKLLQVYSNFVKMVETHFSKCIKIFRFDNALKYTQYVFQAVLHSYGTVHQLTCLGISQQNGRAEQKLHHILDTICALLLSVKVLAAFWGEAALHVVHTINHIPSPIIQNQIPYECLFGSPSDYHHLRSFSSACFVLLQPHEHNKLEPQLRLCCFLGYGETQKGYRCYDLASHRLHISYNVVFWEHRSFVKNSLTSVPPYLPPLSQIFFQMRHIFLLQLLLILLQLLLILLQTSLSNHQISLIPFLVIPFLVHPLMNKLKTSYLTLSLGPLLLLRLKILHKTFHLVTQLG